MASKPGFKSGLNCWFIWWVKCLAVVIGEGEDGNEAIQQLPKST
jgi:hypothetical protein